MFIGNISTKELFAKLDNPDFIVLDIRSSAAYNGWKLQDEVRGGHIRGAISFPLSWIKELSNTELKSLLVSKGVTSKKYIVVYGYQHNDCSILTKLLWNFGIRNIFIYEAGLQKWAAESRLPMEYLANYHKLVYPEWIKKIISGEKQSNNSEKEISVFEVGGGGGIEDYKAGHIPAAIHLDLSSIEYPPTWNICSDDELLDFLLAQGITRNSLVVLYGRDPMAAARAACILMYAGVEDVRLLDGGFDSWLNAGYAVETGARQPTPVESFGGEMPDCPRYIIDIEATKALLADEQGLLVSVRSWEEYIGKTSGYDFIKTRGRIAGAVWGHSGSDPYHMQDYRNPDNTMRSYHEIESIWQEAGITPDKNVAFYCGTGWRASEAFFYAYLMGRQKITVFDGGWLEWSQDDTNPILLGEP